MPEVEHESASKLSLDSRRDLGALRDEAQQGVLERGDVARRHHTLEPLGELHVKEADEQRVQGPPVVKRDRRVGV